MDILLVSNEDTCRTRIAQELLNSFGRGMKISTAGISEGSYIPDAVCNVMEENGYSPSRKKPSGIGIYTRQSWDYVITLCQEAEDDLKYVQLDTRHFARFYFDDPFKKRGLNENEQELQVAALYKEMYYQLYEFYRDELSEQLMPRCTCGANVYCRCE